MSMQSYLDGLRDKPEHVRKRFAFWTSLGATSLLFVFWFSSLSVGSPSQGSVASAVEKAGTPGQSLVAGAAAFGRDLWELIVGPKKVTYSEVEILPGK